MKQKRYFDIIERTSNLKIERVEEGLISRWIAQFGGDDSELELFLIDKTITLGGKVYELHDHAPTPTPKK